MRARIYPLALGKILHHAILNIEQEVAGLLVGKTVSDLVEIWDAVTGPQKGSAGFVKLEEEVMALVAEVLSESFSDLYIVGWYHSHPGLNVFMSPIDIETQKAYQAMFPKALALVIDPVEYSKTGKLSDVKIGIFRLDKTGKVVPVQFTIGLQRQRVLESTLVGLHMLDLILKEQGSAGQANEFKNKRYQLFRLFGKTKSF